MPVLTVQQITAAGVEVTAAAATVTDGDTFANDGRVLLKVINGGVGAAVATIDSPNQCNQCFSHDLTVSVGAGKTKYIGPFPPERFNNASGAVSVVFDVVTDVTLAAVRL